MLTEPTNSPADQAHPETPESWARVLGTAFAVVLAWAFAGMIGGGLLFGGLMAWLAGPEALRNLPYNDSELPAEAQAFISGDAFFLCGQLFGAPVGIALLRLAVRRTGSTAREYLGLRWPGLRQGLIWGLILLASDFVYRFLLVYGLGMSVSKDLRYQEVARIPLFLPLLFVAVAVLTPIFEEFLFRGFLLEGLRRSRLGVVGAILITASLWTLMHRETPVRSLGFLLDGTLLALARLRTGSLYLVVLVHAIGNAVAVLAMASG